MVTNSTRRILRRVLFEVEWAWANAFPGRMMPIGEAARRILRRVKAWARS